MTDPYNQTYLGVLTVEDVHNAVDASGDDVVVGVVNG